MVTKNNREGRKDGLTGGEFCKTVSKSQQSPGGRGQPHSGPEPSRPWRDCTCRGAGPAGPTDLASLADGSSGDGPRRFAAGGVVLSAALEFKGMWDLGIRAAQRAPSHTCL